LHLVLVLVLDLHLPKMATSITYKRAVCCKLPRSLVDQALRMDASHSPIDYENAVKEHSTYVKALEKLGLEVIVLEADESFPDCVFVEDSAVVCNGKALITNPGHPNRKGETVAIKKALENLGLEIMTMASPADMDGGDVLFTGKEFFVGLSKRTDKESAISLKEAFPMYPVHTVPIKEQTLHLKSMMSMVSDDIIAIGPSSSSELAVKVMKEKATFPYKFLKVSADAAANCLWINGTLVHRPSTEFPSIASDYESLNCPKIELSNTELSKVDGALTCCSLLLT